jgi:beta-phosphoglucomutase-like phosphatase (HAD superfamily)
MVENGKPHPEPYLTAASLLGADPAHCVAIEDSPTGVAAALASGCATLGVPHVVDLEPAPRLTLAATLAGLDVTDLARLVQD